MPHFLFKKIKHFSKKKQSSEQFDLMSVEEDERREAAKILAQFYNSWLDEWVETKKIVAAVENDELKFFENDQKREVLRTLARVLTDIEADNGVEFEKDLRKLAENLRPTVLYSNFYSSKKPELSFYISNLATLLKKYVNELVNLEENRLKLDDEPMKLETAEKMLNEELGILTFDFYEKPEKEAFESAIGKNLEQIEKAVV